MVHAQGDRGAQDVTAVPLATLVFGPVLSLIRRRDTPQRKDERADALACQDPTDDSEESDSFDPYYFIKTLPSVDSCVPAHRSRSTVLPRRTRQSKTHTLVLDLDETLVHAQLSEWIDIPHPPSFSVKVDTGGVTQEFAIWERPGLREFVERVAELFEVVVFTASQKSYADRVLNALDPNRRLFRFRLFRDHCVFYDGAFLKDLSVLGRDLSKVVIVDNSPHAFGFQLDNGVPIESWMGDQSDEELKRLLPFLVKLSQAQDVRPLVRESFRLHERVAAARDPASLRRGGSRQGVARISSSWLPWAKPAAAPPAVAAQAGGAA